jgi:acyl-coenzyme A thioesterase 13
MTMPESFEPYGRTSRYLDLIRPLLQHRDDPSTVGLFTDDRHTNSRGIVHGGLLIAIADTIMGHAAERVGQGRRVVTASLTTDFVGAAPGGMWIQGATSVLRTGRRMAFARCTFHCDDRLIVAASGVFTVVDDNAA